MPAELTVLYLACDKSTADIVTILLNHGADPDQAASSGSLPIHLAAGSETDALEKVKILFNINKDYVHARGNGKRIPLFNACCWGTFSVVLLLLGKGAKTDVVDDNGDMPLHFACCDSKKDAAKKVRALIEVDKKAIHTQGQNLHTPLHLACGKGTYDVMALLLQNGAKTDVRDVNGNLPIHLASLSTTDAVEKVKALIKNDASYVHSEGLWKRTPLHEACHQGTFAVVSLLLGQGAITSVKDSQDNLPIHLACASTTDAIEKVKALIKVDASYVHSEGMQKRTPLHAACFKGTLAVVTLLLEQKAKTHVGDTHGNLPIHFACASTGDAVEKVEALIKIDANYVQSVGGDRRTPLHFACRHGTFAVVSLLLERIGRTGVRDRNGELPIHFACMSTTDAVEKIKALIKVDASHVHSKGCKMRTPLHCACDKGSAVVVSLLLEHGAKTDCAGEAFDRLPIHLACMSKTDRVEKVLKLLDVDSNSINRQDKQGNTSLHLASRNYADTVTILLDRGCNVNVTNNDGNTALHLACEEGHLKIATILSTHPQCDTTLHNKSNKTALDIATEKCELESYPKISEDKLRNYIAIVELFTATPDTTNYAVEENTGVTSNNDHVHDNDEVRTEPQEVSTDPPRHASENIVDIKSNNSLLQDCDPAAISRENMLTDMTVIDLETNPDDEHLQGKEPMGTPRPEMSTDTTRDASETNTDIKSVDHQLKDDHSVARLRREMSLITL